MKRPFIAVDWGTTNRRSYLIEDGRSVAMHHDEVGVLAMTDRDWSAEAAGIRARHGDLPLLIAGMAGSNRGWREVAYAECPARLSDLAAGLSWVERGRTAIVPGVAQRQAARPDVMRGEEVQLLGACAAGLAPADALLCQPGTHCKWATMRSGAIDGFATAMTGELFAMVRSHSILAPQLTGAVADGAVFREGVRRGAEGDLAGALFGVRAASVLGLRDDADAGAYASGLLIGSDVAVHAGSGATVYLLAEGALGELYSGAIEALGGKACIADSNAAFVAGISRLAEQVL